jgi:hypothetical protein
MSSVKPGIRSGVERELAELNVRKTQATTGDG